MAKTVTVKRGGTAAKKSGSTAKKGSAAKPSARSTAAAQPKPKVNAKVAKIVTDANQIAARLSKGGKMRAEKERYKVNDDGPIRKALYFAGFDSKGEKHGVKKGDQASLTPAKLKAFLVKERGTGTPWYALEFRTGKPESEIKKVVADAGGPTGRVYRNASEARGR